MTVTVSIGNKIQSLRHQKGLSMKELAKNANISKTYVSFLENEKCENPSVKVLRSIAGALGVDVNDLIE